MKHPCSRCGQLVAKETAKWTMWRNRLVRVGPDCFEAIWLEKAALGSGGGQRPRQAPTDAQSRGIDAAIGGEKR